MAEREPGKPPRSIGQVTIREFRDPATAEANLNELLENGWKVEDSKILKDEAGKPLYSVILFKPAQGGKEDYGGFRKTRRFRGQRDFFFGQSHTVSTAFALGLAGASC